MKKLKLLAASLIVVCVAIIAVLAHQGQGNDYSSILIKNAEALTRAEGSITTWECSDRGDDPCRHYCGVCKSEVTGTGKASGSHSCW